MSIEKLRKHDQTCKMKEAEEEKLAARTTRAPVSAARWVILNIPLFLLNYRFLTRIFSVSIVRIQQNRSTFKCPFCSMKNLDCKALIKHCNDRHQTAHQKVVREIFLRFECFFHLISSNFLCAGVSCLREHALGRQRPSQCQLPSASEHAPSVWVRHNSGAWVG